MKYFGGHIVRSAYYFVSTSSLELALHLILPVEREAKVYQSYNVILCSAKEEVFCLEVAMADLLEVQVLHCLDHLDENVSGLVLVEASELIDAVEEFPAFA